MDRFDLSLSDEEDVESQEYGYGEDATAELERTEGQRERREGQRERREGQRERREGQRERREGDEDELEDEAAGGRRAPRIFRQRACPFNDVDPTSFKKDYRFSVRVFYRICELVGEKLMHASDRSHPLTVPQQVSLCLNLLGRNTKQRDTARMAGCDQATVSRVLVKFVDAICECAGDYIYWPCDEERRRISREIYDAYKLPNVVGYIDGTHVRIIAPNDDEGDYINRKHFHSINVGLICDNHLKFRWVSASFPGSCHDSRVFKESTLYQDLKNGVKHGCLIGDSAYGAESFLIKVVENPSNPAEERYNRAICAARSHIERAVGVLKAQFKILGEECRYKPEFATKLIVCCVVLRNISIISNESFEEFQNEEEVIEEEFETDPAPEASLAGRALIQRIINENFT